MRLIDADALMETMKQEKDRIAAIYGENDEFARCLEKYAMSMVEFAPTIESMQWIPCSERLPKNKKRCYWVCTDTECQCECRWTNNIYGLGDSDNWGWSIFDTPQYTKVVAWMPLPEPYGGDADEDD